MRKVLNVTTGALSDFIGELPDVAAPPYNELVDQETSRRLALPFVFNSRLYDRDLVSLQRIIGAAALAGFAISNGAQEGDYRWHGGATDFSWIANDNVIVAMDAQTMFAFGQAASARESFLIFRGRSLKDNPVSRELVVADLTWA
jgi:hypothetical protein